MAAISLLFIPLDLAYAYAWLPRPGEIMRSSSIIYNSRFEHTTKTKNSSILSAINNYSYDCKYDLGITKSLSIIFAKSDSILYNSAVVYGTNGTTSGYNEYHMLKSIRVGFAFLLRRTYNTSCTIRIISCYNTDTYPIRNAQGKYYISASIHHGRNISIKSHALYYDIGILYKITPDKDKFYYRVDAKFAIKTINMFNKVVPIEVGLGCYFVKHYKCVVIEPIITKKWKIISNNYSIQYRDLCVFYLKLTGSLAHKDISLDIAFEPSAYDKHNTEARSHIFSKINFILSIITKKTPKKHKYSAKYTIPSEDNVLFANNQYNNGI